MVQERLTGRRQRDYPKWKYSGKLDKLAVAILIADCVNAFETPQIGTIKIIQQSPSPPTPPKKDTFQGLAAVKIAVKKQ